MKEIGDANLKSTHPSVELGNMSRVVAVTDTRVRNKMRSTTTPARSQHSRPLSLRHPCPVSKRVFWLTTPSSTETRL